LEGDALRDGAGDGCESLTGTCMIFFPRRVCVVATSHMSGLDPESLIFGIFCGGSKLEVSQHIYIVWKSMCCNRVRNDA